jgi:dTDP-4-dehydrorhamnose reductase
LSPATRPFRINGRFSATRMKVVVTGASGILGTDIVKELKKQAWEVIEFTSKNIMLDDIADVRAKILPFQPDIIIHSAAMTNVDLCEDDREAAIKINVIGTHNISLVAAALQAKVVYISSCGVYGNGKTEAYNELDATNPLTYHHYTKLVGEQRITDHNHRYLIVRTGWLFGGDKEQRKNFVEARRKEATTAQVMRSAGDKFGSPTYTVDLAKQLIVLLDAEVFGVFNAVNTGRASRFDYVAEIVKLLHLSTPVEEVDSNSFPRRANMPDNEVLDNMQLRLRGLDVMRDWKAALKSYIDHTYQQ